MKIGIDATSLCRKLTGIESYALNLIKEILKSGLDLEFIILFRKEVHPELAQFRNKAKFLICPFKQQILCEQVWLPFIAVREKVDLMHFPAFPPGILTFIKFVFTIHDANVWRHPETLSWKGKLYFKPLTILGAKRASSIITVSESSQRGIANHTNIPINKIINTYEGISESFRLLSNSNIVESIKFKYNLLEKIILSVNSIEPRKNISRLLDAFSILKKKSGFIHKLVLVGRQAWGQNEIADKVKCLKLENDIIMLGYVPIDDLIALYNFADLFVFPSIYEGFGLPPLEAMACGVPIVASKIPTLQEIIGDAAVFIDPYDANDIASKIEGVIGDSRTYADLREKGLKRVKLFSWLKVVEKTIDVYKSIR